MNRVYSILSITAAFTVIASPLMAGATCPSCVVRTQNRAPQQSVYYEETPYYKQNTEQVNIQDRDRDQFVNSAEQSQQLSNKNSNSGSNLKNFLNNRTGIMKSKNTAYDTNSSTTTPKSANTSTKPAKEPKYNPFGKDTNSDSNPKSRINPDSAQEPRTLPFQNNMR